MNGNVAVKSFSSFQVNEALLAKVVEAIKVGEADARRYSQIRSFEIYYEGFRQRMLLGRIIIIPAKIADSVEDFPAALLYGAMVKEMRPEDLADLYTYRLGESEFDEYDKKSLAEIKDKLFKDAEGKYRSIVLFVPTWGNVRDYVVLKFNKDPELLTNMVRQQIYGAYFDPALSSAFDHLANDTDNLHVSDITPKLNYPGLAEGLEKNFPEFVAGDGSSSKTASTVKPMMLLAKDTVNEISEEFLEPGERAVIDQLAEDLKAKVSGDVEEPAEVAKQSSEMGPRCEGCGTPISRGSWCAGTYCKKGPKGWNGGSEKNAGHMTPDVNHPRLAIGNAFKLVQKFQLEGEENPQLVTKAIALLESIQPELYRPGQEKGVTSALKHLDEYMKYDGGSDENLARAYTDLEDLCIEMGIQKPVYAAGKESSTDDTGAETGLRRQPDYNEADSHVNKANAAAMKGAAKKAGLEWGIWNDETGFHWKVFKTFLGKDKIIGTGDTPDRETAEIEIKNFLDSRNTQEPSTFNNRLQTASAKEAARGAEQATYQGWLRAVKKLYPNATIEGDRDIASAFDREAGIDIGEWDGARGLIYSKQASKVAFTVEGATLTRSGSGSLIAKSKSGYTERLRINASKVKWTRPSQFTVAFRASVENYIRNPRNQATKVADVPQTFQEIWGEIAEEMGPAPSVTVPDAPKSRLEKMHERRGEDENGKPNLPELTEKKEVADEEKSTIEKSASAGAAVDRFDSALGDVRTYLASEQEGLPNPEMLDSAIDSLKACQTAGFFDSEIEALIVNAIQNLENARNSKGAVAARNALVKAVKIYRQNKQASKSAAFDMFIPGQVLNEFYPEVVRETVEYPSDTFAGNEYVSPDALPAAGDAYVSTDPTAAMGLGRDGKPQILEGAPLRTEQDIRGYGFDQEFYAQTEQLDPSALGSMKVLSSVRKKAANEEFKAQFADFLKKAMGEIAATFIAAFRVTSRPLMNKVPGTGEIRLDQVEQTATFRDVQPLNVSSRVAYLMSKLTDSEIKDAINGAWAQSAVWNEDSNGGYTYEVFVRPEAIDKQTLILKYNFVVGTKGL